MRVDRITLYLSLAASVISRGWSKHVDKVKEEACILFQEHLEANQQHAEGAACTYVRESG